MKLITRIRKFQISPFIALLAFANSAMAENTSPQKPESKPIGIYFGGFGGYGFSMSANEAQKGTAFYPAASGGPLAVNATGSSKSSGFGFGGLHIGYEWLRKSKKNWRLTPGIELEGYYFSDTNTVNLVNPTSRLAIHAFSDTFPMRVGVVMADGILAFMNKYISPYIGGGVGAGIVSIHGATSAQTAPPEAGINHFNSNPNAFDWSFAAQAKGGLRYSPIKWMRVFGEYRFLYLSSTNYTFGSTQYPTHVPTSPWKVSMNSIYYNLFSLGIDFTW